MTAHAADFYSRPRGASTPEVTDSDIRATCGQCCLELTLDQATVEPSGAATSYSCPSCSATLLVVAAIPGERGLCGMRTLRGARTWLPSGT